MQKALEFHSLVPFGKDVVILGGRDSNWKASKGIYKITCSNRACIWTKMEQELSVGRHSFVAIPIPDSVAKCKSKYILCYNEFLFIHQLR